MVGLVIVLVLASASPVLAAPDAMGPVDVLFDRGDPENSVGIIEDLLLVAGDVYENYRVQSFLPKAIVFVDRETGERVALPRQGTLDPEIKKRARDLFVVRQLKAIYEAQTRHYRLHDHQYARDLIRLIGDGFLADGFQDGQKQGYHFEILKVGQTERRAPHYEREPTFLALAEPVDFKEGNLFFSIDQLGQARYGPTRFEASWGPVWHYADWKPVSYQLIQVGEDA